MLHPGQGKYTSDFRELLSLMLLGTYFIIVHETYGIGFVVISDMMEYNKQRRQLNTKTIIKPHHKAFINVMSLGDQAITLRTIERPKSL
jgi:hypothetical protein